MLAVEIQQCLTNFHIPCSIIFTKIDTDDDELVSEPELIDWITKTQQRYLRDNTKREFTTHDEDKDDKITWDEYYQLNFGFLQGL